MNKRHDVLLLEDEVITRDVLELRIKSLGYAVIAVSCPEEALRKLQEATFKFIITDIMMPPKIGEEIVNDCGVQFAINVYKTTPNIPFIFLTGRADVDIEEQIIQASRSNQLNLSAFFRKPFPNHAFKQKLKKLLHNAIQRNDEHEH